MRIALLGSLQVDDGRTTLGPRDRVVLQALATRPGSDLSTEALAETLWGEDLPETWQKVVQGCIVRLRKALGPEAIQTSTNGYRLVMHHDEVDHVHFEDLLARARELLANGEPERAHYVTGQARELWRGEPLVELADWGPGRVEAERLGELWREAEEVHAEAALRSGRHQEAMGDVLRMVAEQPTRERRWGLLAQAQYQAGRQGDALQTLHRAKVTLVNELGLDPGPELAELEQAILRQDPSLTAHSGPAAAAACPYLGLVAYDVSDAPAFFGRQADVVACLRRLDETGVLAVLGPSGCGKSSLIRAGVAAALERDGRRVAVVTPGPHPTEALSATSHRPNDVMVVDQCEEALAPDVDPAERADFFDRLAAFLAAPVPVPGRGALVLSIRADRIGELSAHPEFARLIQPGLYLLGAMSEPDLRLAIEGPAAHAGLRLEPGLVDLLVREVQGEPAALPLLSHVLRQTWKRREGTTLTVAGYSATGGIREAIAQSAESLFRDLTPGQQEVLRDLMVRLVAPDDLGEPARQRVPRRSVATDTDHRVLIERLVGARLLSTDGDTVEIAHEALAVAWPRLRSWLDDDVDGLRIMRHLSVASSSWDDLGRPDSELYRGVRQARAAEWHERSGATLTATERDFLHASAALADKEQRATEAQVRLERRLNQRLRAGLAAVAALLAVAIVAGALALTARNTADREAAATAKQARAADARRLGAEALRSEDLDRSLLLAAAGVKLDNSSDTRASLLATLDRGPALTRTAHSAGHLLSLAVDPVSGRVATTAADAVGLELYDGRLLTPMAIREHLSAGSVFADPDGSGFAVSISADLVKAGTERPVVLLDPSGARSAVQLGGFPEGYQVYDNFGFDPSSRWNMGYSPRGRWFAASLRDIGGTRPDLTVVWDLRSPRHPVARFALLDGKAPMVSSDGRTLYSMSNDPGRLVVTNLPSGTRRRVLSPADLGVHQLDPVLVESPDGRTLAVGAGVEAVLVDSATLRPKAYLSGHGTTSALAFSPDGTRVAATGDRLLVWDVSGAEPVQLLTQAGPVDAPQFSRDGTTVFTKTFAGVLEAWDLAGTRRFIAARPGQPLAWKNGFDRISPDGRKVAYVQLGPRFRVRDLVTGTLGPLVSTSMPQGSYLDIAWHPDSTLINMTTGDPVVRTWDSRTGREVAQRRLAPPPSTEGAAIAFFSLDGKYLLVGTTAGRLHVLDAHTLVPAREPIQVYPPRSGRAGHQDVYDFTPSGDLHTVYLNDAIVDYVAGTVRKWPALGSHVVARFPSPDGRRLLVGTETGTGLLDAETMRWISPPSAAQARFVGGGTKFSDDGSLVASVSNGRLNHWDGRTGAYLGSATVDWDGDPAFTTDDSQLLFAGETGTVVSWNLDPASWVAAACRIAGRDLTEAEWHTYLPGRPFVPVCAS